MKHVLVSFAILLLLSVGCKKENGHGEDPTDTKKKYAVRINASDFTEVIANFDQKKVHSGARDAQDTLRDYIQHLYYVVNGSNGYSKRIDQKAADSSFGTIVDSLAPGRYTVSLIGSKDSVYIGPSFMGYDNEILFFGLPGTDVFYRRTILNVTGEVNQKMSLDRVVAKVKLTIKDAIPADAKTLYITPKISPAPDPDLGYPGALPAGIIVISGELTAGSQYDAMYGSYAIALDSLSGFTNTTVEFYIVTLGAKKISLDLLCKNIYDETIVRKIIQEVNIDVSKKTVLTGKVFDQIMPGNNGITATINTPEWSSDSILIEY